MTDNTEDNPTHSSGNVQGHVPVTAAAKAGPSTPRKRQRQALRSEVQQTLSDAFGVGSSSGVSASPKTSPAKKRKTEATVIRDWVDIPQWRSNKSPLLELPVELLDKIFGSENDLTLQDHLSFSGTCRSVRQAYTEQVWQALYYPYTMDYNSRAVVDRIFSTAWLSGPPVETPAPSGSNVAAPSGETASPQQSPKKSDKGKKNPPLTYRERVAEQVNKPTLTLTDAKAKYKLTDRELNSIPYAKQPNPYRRSGAPMRKYKEARVRALAYRVHGGPLGHAAHLKKLAERGAKAKATREKNGTTPVKSEKTKAREALAAALDVFMPTMFFTTPLMDFDGDDEDEMPYVWDDY